MIRANESVGPVVLRGTIARDSLTPYASVLQTPFVGIHMSALPATSAFGMVARLVRLNGFEPTDMLRSFGIRSRRIDDLSELMTYSEARQAAFASSLNLPAIPPTWNLSAWFPFQSSSEVLKSEWAFRFCPQCLRSGYHTLLHQLPWVLRCPWHGASIRKTCPRCSRAAPVRADWAYECNLTCACGHVLLSTDAALRLSAGPMLGASNFIHRYLDWAREERAHNVLFAPELQSNTTSALCNLVELPADLSKACGAPSTRRHARVWRLGAAVSTVDREALKQFDTLRQDRPGFLTVPARMRGSIAEVAANLALKLPESTLTDREMSLFLDGAGIPAPKNFKPAKRGFSGTLSALPPWEVGGHQFLNLACLHPVSYRPVVRLVDFALDGRSLFDFFGQAAPQELELLIRTCGQLLARGYAEGLRATLSRHVSQLYEMGRDSPHLTNPWILATRQKMQIVSVRAVWSPLDFKQSLDDVLEAADGENARRAKTSRIRRVKKS